METILIGIAGLNAFILLSLCLSMKTRRQTRNSLKSMEVNVASKVNKEIENQFESEHEYAEIRAKFDEWWASIPREDTPLISSYNLSLSAYFRAVRDFDNRD